MENRVNQSAQRLRFKLSLRKDKRPVVIAHVIAEWTKTEMIFYKRTFDEIQLAINKHYNSFSVSYIA